MDDRLLRRAELLANPPAVGVDETKALMPPLTGTGDYMRYLRDNRAAYMRFFGIEGEVVKE